MQSIYTDFFQKKKMKILLEKTYCVGYTLEQPRQGGSNEYPLCMFWIKIKKIRYTPANIVFLYKSGVQGCIYFTDMFS